MKTKELQFDGNIYICRIVKSNEGEELLIGSTALLDALPVSYTHLLGITGGGINPALCSPKTVHRKVRPGWQPHSFIHKSFLF